MINYKQLYAMMRPIVLAVLRSAKRPLTAYEIAKMTGFQPGRVAWALHKEWAEDVIVVTEIPRTYTIR